MKDHRYQVPQCRPYFFESKGMDVNMIKIEGSVELAPLLGLSDAIVDIVETGSTLKENGLEVIEDDHPDLGEADCQHRQHEAAQRGNRGASFANGSRPSKKEGTRMMTDYQSGRQVWSVELIAHLKSPQRREMDHESDGGCQRNSRGRSKHAATRRCGNIPSSLTARRPNTWKSPKKRWRTRFGECDAEFVEALRAGGGEHPRISITRQKQQSWLTTKENGVILGQRIRGLYRVGIYVPGGTAAYPSSVLMNAIPAKIAGVEEIIMVTPPGKDGKPNPDIMAAAAVAGVDRVFLMGGAQAVAALAYRNAVDPQGG